MQGRHEGHLRVDRERDQAHLRQTTGGIGEDQRRDAVPGQAREDHREENRPENQDERRADGQRQNAHHRARRGSGKAAADHDAQHELRRVDELEGWLEIGEAEEMDDGADQHGAQQRLRRQFQRIAKRGARDCAADQPKLLYQRGIEDRYGADRPVERDTLEPLDREGQRHHDQQDPRGMDERDHPGVTAPLLAKLDHFHQSSGHSGKERRGRVESAHPPEIEHDGRAAGDHEGDETEDGRPPLRQLRDHGRREA